MTIAYGGKRTITFLQAWILSFVESRKKMHFTKLAAVPENSKLFWSILSDSRCF